MGRKKAERVAEQSTMQGLIEGAFSVFSELADEMREAFDNTPENLQQSGVGEARGMAADELENNVDAPEVPEWLTDAPVSYFPETKKRQSRSDRRGQATYELQQCIDALERLLDESGAGHNDQAQEEAVDNAITDEQRDESESRQGDIEELRDELQNAIDSVDGVEFPGMYG